MWVYFGFFDVIPEKSVFVYRNIRFSNKYPVGIPTDQTGNDFCIVNDNYVKHGNTLYDNNKLQVLHLK